MSEYPVHVRVARDLAAEADVERDVFVLLGLQVSQDDPRVAREVDLAAVLLLADPADHPLLSYPERKLGERRRLEGCLVLVSVSTELVDVFFRRQLSDAVHCQPRDSEVLLLPVSAGEEHGCRGVSVFGDAFDDEIGGEDLVRRDASEVGVVFDEVQLVLGLAALALDQEEILRVLVVEADQRRRLL